MKANCSDWVSASLASEWLHHSGLEICISTSEGFSASHLVLSVFSIVEVPEKVSSRYMSCLDPEWAVLV